MVFKLFSFDSFKCLLINFTVVNILFFSQKVLAQSKIIENKCNNNLDNLANSLVKDIPDYANRVIQRNRIFSHSLNFFPIYVVTAGKVDLTSLPLKQNQYQTSFNSEFDRTVKQIFFTTLERQYSFDDRIIETQNFHWLILTSTPDGWQMITLLTRLGYPNQNGRENFVVSPPQDSTEGIIGQSVKLWLRDCLYLQK